ncbi:hypothetical protein [Nocardioides montaniterrae]
MLPRLGPRTWWVYLALDGPRTSADLSRDAGIVEESIVGHLRKLEKAGLARHLDEPGATRLWERARELDHADTYRVVGKVQRGHLMEPPDTLLPERGDTTEVPWWRRWV